MIRLSLLAAAFVTLAALPQVALAQEDTWRTNLVVGGGFSLARGSIEIEEFNPAPLAEGEKTYATNWGGRVFVGTMLADSVVAKVEANYQYFDFNDSTFSNVDTDVTTGFLVGQVRIPVPGLLRPYVEAGIGAAYVEFAESSELATAYRFGIGADYAVSNNASIFAQLDYTRVDDFELTDSFGRTGEFSLDYFSVVIGANTYF